MPCLATIYNWRAQYPQFDDAYRQAMSQRTVVVRRHSSRPDGSRRRSPVYSDALSDRICHLLLKGWSLSDVARSGLAPRSTLGQWLREHRAFQLRYAIACHLRDEIIADQALATVDAGRDNAAIRSRLASIAPRRWRYW